jgi:hypothetical protein
MTEFAYQGKFTGEFEIPRGWLAEQASEAADEPPLHVSRKWEFSLNMARLIPALQFARRT